MAAKKFCVIGVGRFGYHVATKLAEHGMEVLAVDSNESIVASIRDRVTQAICMRIRDEESLRSIGIEEMDAVIVAIGEEFSQSILVTALLKQKLKISNVIVRSITTLQRDILELIGADQIILPEQEMGSRLADKLSLKYGNFIRITENFSINYFKAPAHFVGEKISELPLKEYHVTLVGKKEHERIIELPQDYIIQERDVLAVAGINSDLEKLAKL
jgi:trk system potassium uptake protein